MTRPVSRTVPAGYLTYEQYNQAEKNNTAGLLLALYLLLRPYLALALSDFQWVAILQQVYPTIESYRRQSAILGRRLYDSERRKFFEDNVLDLDDYRATPIKDVTDPVELANLFRLEIEYERHPVKLASYKPDWFIEKMEPAKKNFLPDTATVRDLNKVISTAVKEVQNGARSTITRATRDDRVVLGWARVEGGGESCAFCTMLISRGPVYRESDMAGLDARSDVQAVAVWRAYNETGDDKELMALMNRWHVNCDCRVVPVFDRMNWPGRDEYLEAERLWIEATRDYTGKDKLNALRRLMGDGYKQGDVLPLAA